MIPSQLIRSLATACRLAGIERAHQEAVSAGDDAPVEVALDLVDALLEALERRLPDRPARATGEEQPEPTTRTARYLARVRELAAAGWSDPRIAAEVGRTADAIRRLRARYDVPAGVAPGGASLTTGWQDVIRALHAEGLTTAQIAERSGYTVRTVQQRLHELGLRAIRPSADRVSDQAASDAGE